MYAVVNIAGFDYKVKPGDRISIPYLEADKGKEVEFPQVKLLNDDKELKLSPKAIVKAKVVGHRRGKKVIVYKFKKRKGFRNKAGYRDMLTDIEVTAITPGE
jgi:large subunit ribosomal protein L21